jgi:MFS family permease
MFTGSVCGTILAAWQLDRRGRRRMLISLLCGIFVFHLGLSLTLPNQLVQVVISVISASCFVSLHVVAEFIFTVYISDVFPLYYRGKMDPMRIRERVLT